MRTTAEDIRNRAGAASGRRAAAAGFTLMELLVAVGALAFVAVGIAAIFEATGRTVRVGRRVSDFSAYANLIEQQMRADFASMTREGFLLIRNQYADANGDGSFQRPINPALPNAGDDVVPLYSDDLNPRTRRIDEILFFAKGQFRSLRDPLDPRFVASANAAAIYYGHGERRVYDATAGQPYLAPELSDNVSTGPNGIDPDARLGYAPTNGTVNPNRYASDWTLVRRVTLLRPPQTTPLYKTAGEIPTFLSNVTTNNSPDSDVQIALQPAASSLFRGLMGLFPATAPQVVRNSSDPGYDHPQIASGLVDIATTDLPEIRMIVMTSDKYPGQAGTNFFDPALNQTTTSQGDSRHPGVDGVYRLWGVGVTAQSDPGVVWRAQAWMDDAMPAWSMAGANPPNGGEARKQTRVRCEPAPTNLIGVGTDPAYSGSPVAQAYRRTDQMMLSASNFLPHCTEFIVEWTFGDTDAATGQYKWHGMDRTANGRRVTTEYDDADPQLRYGYEFPYVPFPGSPPANWTGRHTVWAPLIHGNPLQSQGGTPLALPSYFGYVDPTFDPERPDLSIPVNQNGKLDRPGEATTPTMPWPWPRLIRVTLSLADPNDPSVEQSFQFVFDVPQGTQ